VTGAFEHFRNCASLTDYPLIPMKLGTRATDNLLSSTIQTQTEKGGLAEFIIMSGPPSYHRIMATDANTPISTDNAALHKGNVTGNSTVASNSSPQG
jgi:hypothetical protein